MKKLIFLFMIISLASCSQKTGFEKAYDNISIDEMKRHVSILASDEFMGRAPFTEGEELTVEYLKNELEKMGFEPAFGGSYYQPVPMVEIKSEVKSTVDIQTEAGIHKIDAPDDIALISPRIEDKISIDKSELVFAGFGIRAEEYDWNDFSDLDVEGKTIVVFVNDPGLYTGDNDLFKGSEMTYYGRWTYKYEQDRYLYPDPNAYTGMYFRSDHFAFAKKGVPSLYARGNCDSREYGKEWAAAHEEDYINRRYHRPADNYEPDKWNFEGIREDAQLAFKLGHYLANSSEWPRWKEGSEFRELR